MAKIARHGIGISKVAFGHYEKWGIYIPRWKWLPKWLRSVPIAAQLWREEFETMLVVDIPVEAGQLITAQYEFRIDDSEVLAGKTDDNNEV